MQTGSGRTSAVAAFQYHTHASALMQTYVVNEDDGRTIPTFY